jgi:hypothetical protein
MDNFRWKILTDVAVNWLREPINRMSKQELSLLPPSLGTSYECRSWWIDGRLELGCRLFHHRLNFMLSRCAHYKD